MATYQKDNSPERSYAKISVNKLGEYAAESNASRRYRIIRDQKRPSENYPPIYGCIRDAIVQYVANGEENLDPVYKTVNELGKDASRSSWWRNRFRSSRDAVVSFKEKFETLLPLKNSYTVPVRKNDPSDIWIEGVRVTMRPDLLVFGQDGHGKDIAGVIKLHFSKNNTLNKKAGLYVATLLQRFVKEQIADDSVHVSDKRCMVLDIFTGRRYTAPRAYKQRREELERACLGIKSIWPHV